MADDEESLLFFDRRRRANFLLVLRERTNCERACTDRKLAFVKNTSPVGVHQLHQNTELRRNGSDPRQSGFEVIRSRHSLTNGFHRAELVVSTHAHDQAARFVRVESGQVETI